MSGEGEVRNPALRLRMVVAGFMRYGEMEKVGDTEVAFICRWRHDELMRLLLPYSRKHQRGGVYAGGGGDAGSDDDGDAGVFAVVVRGFPPSGFDSGI